MSKRDSVVPMLLKPIPEGNLERYDIRSDLY